MTARAPARAARLRLAAGAGLVLLLAFVPYAPFAPLPLISDDYMQIGLARKFSGAEGLAALAGDALYRCRATSLVFSRAVDAAFGPDAAAHRLASVAVHALNLGLIVLLGSWPGIGWRRALLAAAAFALIPGHQEAMVWIAAVHEPIAFGFATLSLLAWAHWLRTRSAGWLALALGGFALGLLSKESVAALPALFVGVWRLYARPWRTPVVVAALCGVAVAVYAWAIFAARGEHQHLDDGTFSFSAPVYLTLPNSLFRLYWPWGWAAIAYLAWAGRGRIVGLALAYSVVTLLPYSFLTYMIRVPSRHTYWASLGVAFVLAVAFEALVDAAGKRRVRLGWALGAAFAASSLVHLWTRKLDQYRERAQPTELFLEAARRTHAPIVIASGPYHPEIYRWTIEVGLGQPRERILEPGQPAPPDAIVFDYPPRP